MQTDRLFQTLPAPQVGMQHLAHNGSRPYDRDLHHNVIKTRWLQLRQAGHLRPALHLKQSNGIGGARQR